MTQQQTAATLPAGAAILDDVEAAVRRYCVLPSEHAVAGVALWVAYTYMTDAFEYAPRLVVRSAEKRSGKSRLLEIVDALVYKPLRAVNATVSYIFRSLDQDTPPTLLLDEADTIFGSKKVAEQNEDLRGLLNAGFQRGLTFGRTVGPNHEPKEFATFAPAALAGIGAMPDTIEDRAVVIVMQRRKPGEKVAPYRTRRDKPALVALGHELDAWAVEVMSEATGYEPPNLGIEDRAADVWEPLVTVADMAGGAWPAKARAAAKAFVDAADDEAQEQSLNVKLLSDIREIFDDAGTDFIASTTLVERLRGLDEAPWDGFELNAHKLSRRLREYSVKPGQNTERTARGYRREDLYEAWQRYLPAQVPSESVQTVRNGFEQEEQSGHLKTAGHFKVSGRIESVQMSPQVKSESDTLDGSGRVPAQKSACGDCTAPKFADGMCGACPNGAI